jgi:hypothetical protein
MHAIGPKVVGSNLANSNGFSRAIKICNMTSFSREVKMSAQCHKILWHVKDTLRYDRDTDRQNSVAISHPVSPHFAIRCLCCNQSRELWWIN